jgi:Family of unknown function (DUF5906)
LTKKLNKSEYKVTATKMSSLLGTPTEEFNCNKLRKLLHEAKSREDLKPAKAYLLGYFARGDTGVYKWVPDLKTFKHYNKRDACDTFIQNVIVIFNHGVEKVSIRNWFFEETPFFTIDVNPTKSLTYKKPCGAYTINNFPGFLHPNPPPFYRFSKEIRDQVKLVINHMREVLCSSDKKQELYMMGLVLRITIGQKMRKSMFLYSGPGTGKTMLTWFLRNMVLGPKITTKTADERVITGEFNKELEGRVLLILEEMSNSKSTDWITFANRLKDFIDSSNLMIKEKYKTPYPVTNITNLIINSNNSKTIRLDKNDRRYFIPDISEKYVENGIGMDHYYAPLDKAIKNPEVGKAFYSYALEYVKLNPGFNERKIPMSKTKLMMISRDINPVHEFRKQKYICEPSDINVSSTGLYNAYKYWSQENFGIKKRPLIIQEFTRTLGELGLKPKAKRMGERSKNKRIQWYSTSYNDLYTIFRKKNMIDEAENIDEPEGYQHTENIELSLTSPEVFPAEEESLDSPLAPPTNSTDLTSIPEANEADDEVYESDGSESEYTKESSAPKKPEESNESKQLPAVDDTEPYGIPSSSNSASKVSDSSEKPLATATDEDYDKFLELLNTENGEKPQNDEDSGPQPQEAEIVNELIPEPIVYKIDTYEKIFEQARCTWKICEYDIDDFDWECFIQEIEEHMASKKREDSPWYRFMGEAVDKCRYYLIDKKTKSTGIEYPQVSDSEVIKDLSSYGDKRLIAYVPIPEDYASTYIVPSTSSQSLNKEEKREDSKEDEDFSDDDNDEEWYDELSKMANNKIENKK